MFFFMIRGCLHITGSDVQGRLEIGGHCSTRDCRKRHLYNYGLLHLTLPENGDNFIVINVVSFYSERGMVSESRASIAENYQGRETQPPSTQDLQGNYINSSLPSLYVSENSDPRIIF